MGDKPIWEQDWVQLPSNHYQFFDNERVQLSATYIDTSCLTWERQQFLGRVAKILHGIMAQDQQPVPDSCIISMVVGQLKVDEDPITGFHCMFLLKNINDAWVCSNGMFRGHSLHHPGIACDDCMLD
uniref:Nuclear transport factor 2 n=1 Tax=Ailuropoda melanoleuca TaxID=9646 RepID=A0A7N5JRI6_AILME